MLTSRVAKQNALCVCMFKYFLSLTNQKIVQEHQLTEDVPCIGYQVISWICYLRSIWRKLLYSTLLLLETGHWKQAFFPLLQPSLMLLVLDNSLFSVPPVPSCLFQFPFASPVPSLFCRIWYSLLGIAISHIEAWCKDAQWGLSWWEGQDNLSEPGTAPVNLQGLCSFWAQEIQVVPLMLPLMSLHGISLCRVDSPPDPPLFFLGTVLI